MRDTRLIGRRLLDKYEVMALLGNYQLNPDQYRERGYAGFVEFKAAEWAGVGVSSGPFDDDGASWTWQPLTADSTADNLRPTVPRWRAGRCVDGKAESGGDAKASSSGQARDPTGRRPVAQRQNAASGVADKRDGINGAAHRCQ